MAGIAGGFRRAPEAFCGSLAAALGEALTAAHGQCPTTLRRGSTALVAVPLEAGRAGGSAVDPASGSSLVLAGEARRGAWLSPDEILGRFLEDGTPAFRALDGRFALAVHDAREDSLVIATDRWGTLPVYVVDASWGTLFSTSFAALLADPSWSRDIDLHAVLEMLSFGCLQGPRTLFARVRVLDPATSLTVRAAGARSSSYVCTEEMFPQPEEPPSEHALEAIRLAFNRAVAARAESSRVPVLLSGGLDSRAILSAALAGGLDPRAYTYGEAGSLDVEISREIAASLGFSWRHFPVPRETCYSPDNLRAAVRATGAVISAIHSIGIGIVGELAAAEASLLLGNGAEFVRGGLYDGIHDRPPPADDLAGLARVLTRRFNVAFPLEERHGILRDEVYGRIRDLAEEGTRRALEPLEPLPPEDRIPAYFLRERTRRYLNCGGPVFFGDRIACRFPFFDRDYIRACGRLERARWAAGSAIHRHIIARNSERLARFRSTFPLPIVPGRRSARGSGWLSRVDELLRKALRLRRRRTVGYVDTAAALLHQRAAIRGWLESSTAVDVGLFDPGKVRSLLDDASGPPVARARRLAAALTVELFLREFVADPARRGPRGGDEAVEAIPMANERA